MVHAGSYEILGIGAPLMDHILKVPESYLDTISGTKWGMETVPYAEMIDIIEKSGSIPIQIAGGSAANAIKGLAALGRKCAMAGMIGTDPIGEKLQIDFQSYGIEPRFRFGTNPTGHVACLVTPDGKRTCRTFAGASLEMRRENLDQADFSAVRHTHIEGYTFLCPGLTHAAMEMAKQNGSLVSFDLASLEIVNNNKMEILNLLARYVDVVFANEQEAYALTGSGPETSCKFLKTLCPTAVVMVGSQGCWVGNENELLKHPAIPVKVIDTTGAGDLFASGFLHRYLDDQPLEACAELGVRVASEVIQVIGAEIPPDRWKALKKVITTEHTENTEKK